MQEGPLLDELMANAWRPKVVETYGGWRYRWADGVTRRANSALAVRADASVRELVDRATAFYRQRGAPTLIQVSTMSAPQSLIAYLHAHGFRSTARTLVESAATQDVIERTRPTLEIEIAQTPTEEWFRTYWAVESTRGRSDSDMAVCRDILLDPGLPTAFAAVRCGSEVTGVGQLVIERGWGGVQCMATAPAQRRRGVANAVLNGLSHEARQRGIERMYLAVMAENAAATALYQRAGFRAVHEYSYFTDHPD